MTDYISREAVIEALGEEPFGWAGTDAELQAMLDWKQFKAMVESISAADVVPVVRCNDCKHAMMTSDGASYKWCCHWNSVYDDNTEPLYLPAEFYCAAGERRE